MTERRRISQCSRFEDEIGYSRAVVDGEWVHVSGTTGYDYAAMTISPDVMAQCRQALANIRAALVEAGGSFDDVVRVRYYFTERGDFPLCIPLLREAFGGPRPAATMVVVTALADPAMKIEIEVTARIPGR